MAVTFSDAEDFLLVLLLLMTSLRAFSTGFQSKGLTQSSVKSPHRFA